MSLKWRMARTNADTINARFIGRRSDAIYTDGYLTPYPEANPLRDKLAFRITEAAHSIFLIETFLGQRNTLGPASSLDEAIAKCEERLTEWLLMLGLRHEPDATAIYTDRLNKIRAEEATRTEFGFTPFVENRIAKEITECETALKDLEIAGLPTLEEQVRALRDIAHNLRQSPTTTHQIQEAVIWDAKADEIQWKIDARNEAAADA